ncbi:hypothetical protein [Actinomadura kijaniata]|nr:hypothetical protein [Actinomadura kijaniata]
MAIAADLLRMPGTTVAAVRKAGYADAFAFNNTFKRVRDSPPTT